VSAAVAASANENDSEEVRKATALITRRDTNRGFAELAVSVTPVGAADLSAAQPQSGFGKQIIVLVLNLVRLLYRARLNAE